MKTLYCLLIFYVPMWLKKKKNTNMYLSLSDGNPSNLTGAGRCCVSFV